MDDRALARAIVAGDDEAFRALVEREAPAVVRLCARILGDADSAEDVAQECFMSARQFMDRWRAEGSLHGWILRIAANRALRVARRTPRHAALEDAAGEPIEIVGAGEPLADLLEAERGRTVRNAVAALPEPYRETIVLRYFGELSLAEIAQVTGKPLGTVKTHLGRGLVRLRPALEEVRQP